MWSDWFTGWLTRIPCEKFTECQAGLYQSENNNNKYAERGCGPTSPHPLFFFCMLPNQGNHFTLPTTNYQQKYTVQVNSRKMFKVRAFISFEGKTQIIYKSYLWKKNEPFFNIWLSKFNIFFLWRNHLENGFHHYSDYGNGVK